jgi:predicted acylesterase/phospholipase RssA
MAQKESETKKKKYSSKFDDDYSVFKKELEEIKKRRLLHSKDGEEETERLLYGKNKDDFKPCASKGLVGLALSGGGIRSATFNLGLLQALFKFNFLKKVDYLSTVSGGGYIGTFLNSLLCSNGKENLWEPENFPLETDPPGGNGKEKRPVNRR